MYSQYINRYIQFHATDAVIVRGKKLCSQNHTTLLEFDDIKDSAEFTVMGSQLYRVRIKDFKINNITASCTCPYDWNILCKHSVAALLHLTEVLEKRLSLPEKVILATKRKDASEPIEILQWKRLNREALGIGDHYKNYNLGYYYAQDLPKILSASETQLVFEVESPESFYPQKSRVTFDYFQGRVFAHSSELAQQIKKFSLSETICLHLLINSDNREIFNYFFEGGFSKRKAEIINEFDLSEQDDFYNFFKIALVEGDIEFVKHKQGMGLISPKMNNYLINGIKYLGNAQLFTPLHGKTILHLGFIIYKKHFHGRDFDIIIDAITGQPNKANTDLATHLNYYTTITPNESCPLTDKQTKLLALLKEYESYGLLPRVDLLEMANRNGGGKEHTELKGLHELQVRLNIIQNIFALLADEKYVYFKTENDSEGKIKKKLLQKLRVAQNPLALTIKVDIDHRSIMAEPYFDIDGTSIPVSQKNVISNGFFTTMIGDILYAYDNINTCQYLLNFNVPVKTSLKYKEFFIKELIEPLSQQFKIDFGKDIVRKKEHFSSAEESQLFISEENDFLRFDPVVVYSNGLSVLLYNRGNKLEITETEMSEFIRDEEYENSYLEFLASLHPEFEKQKYNRFFYLPFENLLQDMWFYAFYEQVNKRNVKVFGINELKKFKYSPFKATISTSIKSGQDWFELDIQVKFGDYRIKIADLKRAIINQQLFIQLNNGTVGILPEEWLDKFSKYFRNALVSDEKLHISKLKFNIIDQLFENIDNEQILKEIAEKRQLLKTIGDVAEVQVPQGIKANLRDYQKEGLQWLNFLDSMKWGGILADDMGLGKTLQILAFLKLKLKKSDHPALIIVPTTLLFNWENEIAKFAPSLKVLYYYGIDREKTTDEFSKYQLVFTTYGVLTRDIELLKDYRFSYAILDESQAIKNPASHRYKAAILLNARNKFALTGTPIENSTFDLFAQMNFVNPGFFGDIKGFKENYSNRIDKEGDALVSEELAKLSKPFILRRTKELVAKELPEKTEDIIYCEMEPEQRKVYEAWRNEYRDKILKKIEDDGLEKSKLFILEGLLRLRQICDSPLLLKQQSVTSGPSIKIKEILSLILEKTAKHKILVFSQFVGMLQLIKSDLDKHHIDYEYLDGQSTSQQRKESVEHFQQNSSVRVFLVSLKAGGTGLNLTSADYVVLVDPWWNPAVEAQAIDRSHRIGQDKKVIAYRMICTNTIEEKIINLQKKKKKIASDIIQNDQNIIKNLKPEDIRELFS